MNRGRMITGAIALLLGITLSLAGCAAGPDGYGYYGYAYDPFYDGWAGWHHGWGHGHWDHGGWGHDFAHEHGGFAGHGGEGEHGGFAGHGGGGHGGGGGGHR